MLLTRECKWLSYGGDVGWFALPQLAECPEAPEPAKKKKKIKNKHNIVIIFVWVQKACLQDSHILIPGSISGKLFSHTVSIALSSLSPLMPAQTWTTFLSRFKPITVAVPFLKLACAKCCQELSKRR